MKNSSKFGITFAVVCVLLVATTWSEFKYVASCIFKQDTNYINQDAVDLIDQKVTVGVQLQTVRDIFERDIPGGTFSNVQCTDDLDVDVPCGEDVFSGTYPFGIHDCICGRPIRNFTLLFDKSLALSSLNFLDRKSCI